MEIYIDTVGLIVDFLSTGFFKFSSTGKCLISFLILLICYIPLQVLFSFWPLYGTILYADTLATLSHSMPAMRIRQSILIRECQSGSKRHHRMDRRPQVSILFFSVALKWVSFAISPPSHEKGSVLILLSAAPFWFLQPMTFGLGRLNDIVLIGWGDWLSLLRLEEWNLFHEWLSLEAWDIWVIKWAPRGDEMRSKRIIQFICHFMMEDYQIRKGDS